MSREESGISTHSNTGFSPLCNSFKPIVGGCNDDNDISDEGFRVSSSLLEVAERASSGRKGQGTKKFQPTILL